jgi:histidyl-tRNA synthetase
VPFKALQIGNVWRADNPQKGRFRQFVQCDIDILGDDTNLAEIELISATADMLSKIFAEIGITDFTIHINDRQILRGAALKAGFSEDDIPSVLISLDKFDKIGLDGIRKDLVENGFPEETVDRYLSIYSQLGTETDCASFCEQIGEEFLPAQAAQGLTEIMAGAKEMISEHVKLVFDPTLVRGMGYYTGTIFEASIDGYNFSIAGGGRYDKMIGKFCGQDVSACGFSIGFERIITILGDHLEGGTPVAEEHLAILIDKNAPMEKKLATFARARQLREEGTLVTILPMRKNMKQQISKLEEQGYHSFEKVYKD